MPPAVAGLTASVVAFVVTSGAGWITWMAACWLAGGLCALTLLVGERAGQTSGTGPQSAGPQHS
ncbi:hypothetical protein [Streptomyces antarcticus]|uniref:hypothetical protein n=1 Tax=Streptomyces antarcticus TaxID=2996458 RepID=UPI00227046F8|nr:MULTISPECIES: hypothetical protein [unclassified Streptomyces]MCY0944166.1 hypothetical protein [Streptomyces sp. H34-AA3]MCZ4086887.1 hypothetical protein [Streptomyces sp. H34-S5]